MGLDATVRWLEHFLSLRPFPHDQCFSAKGIDSQERRDVYSYCCREKCKMLIHRIKLVRMRRFKKIPTMFINHVDDAGRLLSGYLHDEPEENLVVLSLTTRRKICGLTTVNHGTLNSTTIRMADIFKPAILHNAMSIIVGHNHPSGDSEPSSEDIAITREIQKAGELLNIEVEDHIVTGGFSYSSIRMKNGLTWNQPALQLSAQDDKSITKSEEKSRREMPKRIQRKRTRGWRMPANTVYVGRPTKWGNPYLVNEFKAAKMINWHYACCSDVAVIMFKKDLEYGILGVTPEDVWRDLRGKNLACWCPLGEPCHADVLLELANKDSA